MDDSTARHGNDPDAALAAQLRALAASTDDLQGHRRWDGLARAVDSPTSSGASGAAELAALRQQPQDRQRAATLAHVLLARASDDQQFRAALSDWRSQIRGQESEHAVSAPGPAPAGSASAVRPEHEPSPQEGGGPGKRWRDRLAGPWPVTVGGGLLVTIVGGVVVALIAAALIKGNSPTEPPPSSGPTQANTVGTGQASATLAVPIDVTATAANEYTITVGWADSSVDITGFHIDNGCPLGACGGRDAELFKTTGPVRSTVFTVTPGSWTCFRVQAFNSFGESGWSGYGCTLTPALLVPGTQKWTDTGVTVNAGDRLAIRAAGTVYIDSVHPTSPSGASSCTPAANYSVESSLFPAPHLPCWSLIARIGDAPPFEVGASLQIIATAGRLYLGVNASSFASNSGWWTVGIAKGGALPSQ